MAVCSACLPDPTPRNTPGRGDDRRRLHEIRSSIDDGDDPHSSPQITMVNPGKPPRLTDCDATGSVRESLARRLLEGAPSFPCAAGRRYNSRVYSRILCSSRASSPGFGSRCEMWRKERLPNPRKLRRRRRSLSSAPCCGMRSNSAWNPTCHSAPFSRAAWTRPPWSPSCRRNRLGRCGPSRSASTRAPRTRPRTPERSPRTVRMCDDLLRTVVREGRA